MNLYNIIILASSDNAQVLAGLLAIFSMVVARLLDWYFPSKHHRRLNEEKETEKPKSKVEVEDFEEVEDVEEEERK